MKLSAKPLGPRFSVFLLWLSASLSAFWSSPPKAILFGIGFGLLIWTSAFLGSETRISRKTDAILTGSFGLVFVSFVLTFQMFENPFVTAGLLTGYFLAVITVRWLFRDYSFSQKAIAEQDEDAKPDNAPS